LKKHKSFNVYDFIFKDLKKIFSGNPVEEQKTKTWFASKLKCWFERKLNNQELRQVVHWGG